ADRGLRRHPRRRARRPIAVLQGPERAVLRREPPRSEGLPGTARRLLAPEHAGGPQERLRLHRGVLGDRPDGGSAPADRADALHPRRRRPDRADRRRLPRGPENPPPPHAPTPPPVPPPAPP